MADAIEITIHFDRETGEVRLRYGGSTILLPETYKKTEKALVAGAKYAAKLAGKGD